MLLGSVSGTVLIRYLGDVVRAARAPNTQRAMDALDQLFGQAVAPAPLDARIGFFMGRPIHADENADGNTAVFYTAQYAAAPRVMVPDTSPRLVLMMLPSDQALLRLCRERGLKLLSHPAPGMGLTERPRG